eukprot:121750_1
MTTDTKANTETKEEEKHKSGFKTGKYSPFTGFYGVFQTIGSATNKSCVSRHDTSSSANQSAIELFESFRARCGEGFGCEDIMGNDPFHAFATIGLGSNTLWIEVKELELEKCLLPQLKQIANREGVDMSMHKGKKRLFQKLKPLIEHKKHLNRYDDFDFARCDLCKVNHPELYAKYQEEQARNPLVVRHKLINNMYRKTMRNPIKESEVTSTYGLDPDELEKAVIAQEVHFQRKVCFGNQYIRYEKADIIKFHAKMQRLKKGKETESKKRKLEEIETSDSSNKNEEPSTKKRRMNDDFKGVPEILREYKWLYQDCDALTQEGRQKIIDYFMGEYTKKDVETEDVLLKRNMSVERNESKTSYTVTTDSVFRMCFQTKRWRKVCVRTKKPLLKTT